MTDDYQIKIINAIDHLFHKRGGGGDLALLFAKVVDGFYIVGTNSKIAILFGALNKALTLGNIERWNELKFLGCIMKRRNNSAFTKTMPK